MDSVKKFQDQLIATSKETFHQNPLSQATLDAFYAVPRHKFVKRYRPWRGKEWFEVTPENLEQHLASIYADNPMILFGEDKDFEGIEGKTPVSTISQPSFVLRMLDILRLEKGQKVFELGAGSGWNAGLAGHIVGPEGKVVSIEIIPDLVKAAQASIQELGLQQVEICQGDGGDGYEKHAPYDRAVFTAGSYDLPRCFYRQVKNGGLLLFVLKNKGGADTLILLEKRENHFRSVYSMSCGFVPLTGKFHVTEMEARALDSLLSGNQISPQPVDQTPFWWAGSDEDSFIWKTAGLFSFLSMSEPLFVPIKVDEKRATFGLFDSKQGSLVVARHDRLLSYGSTRMKDYLLSSMKRWIDLGMPGLSNLDVRAYPIDQKVEAAPGEWIVRRNESQFVWSLPKRASSGPSRTQ